MKIAKIARSSLLLLGVLAFANTALHAQGPSDKKAQQIRENAQKMAQQGNANAQYNMGVLYDEGYGVDRDYEKARKWYKKAADQAYAKAEHNLGIMYQQGHGVDADAGKASKWFRRAANHGEPAAQNNLAVMYVRGQGVPQDLGKAAFWVARAAKAGNKSASKNLPRIAENLPSAKIKGDKVNIRQRPTKNGKVVRQANNGTQVRILAQKNDWSQVLFTEQHSVGWVADFLLVKNSGSGQSSQQASASAASQNQDNSGSSQSAGSGQNNSAAQNTNATGQAGSGTSQSNGSQGKRASITGNGVNIREKPNKSAGVMLKASKGQKVTVLESKNKWRKVRFDNGRTGWVASFLVSGGSGSGSGASASSSAGSSGSSQSSGNSNQSSAGKSKHIGASTVNIRQKPSTNAEVAFQADKGQKVSVIGKQNDWRHVSFDDGRKGWVAAFLLTK